MTEEEARAKLSALTAAGEKPELDDSELDELLATWAVKDSEDREPTDEAWERTHNFNGAAADGWRRKQGKVASTSSSRGLEGDYEPDSYLFLHCKQMAEFYAAKDVWVA